MESVLESRRTRRQLKFRESREAISRSINFYDGAHDSLTAELAVMGSYDYRLACFILFKRLV